MKARKFVATLLVVVLLLSVAVSMGQAQGPGADSSGPEEPALAQAALDDGIPIQGRLTDSHGHPLNGTYNIKFSLYKTSAGGTAVCSDTDPVAVSNGLFSARMDYCTASDISGDQLYLGIKVGSDPEMTPRKAIYAIPYARSLRPGAMINYNGTASAFNVYNQGNGWGIDAYSKGHDAIHGHSDAANHAGVSGANTGGGIGVYAYSNSGTALSLAGTGVIQSSARSYMWISGNGVRPFHHDDSTVIDLDTVGGAIVKPGVAATSRYVMLPVTVPGPLYGQNVTVSGLDVYWVGDTSMDSISDVRLRRQTGVCSSCYVNILHDAADHICDNSGNPTGCTLHYNLSSNNVLTANSGILYLVFQLKAGSSSSWINIGGVRLTLEHD